MLIITFNAEVSNLQTVQDSQFQLFRKDYRPNDLLILREVHRHACNCYAQC